MARTPDSAAHDGPRLNLPIFLLALFGVLVVVHLWVQKHTGFAFGCTGAGDAASGAGCATVTFSVYSTLLGVSLLVWGGLFYVVLAALRAGIAALKPPTSDTLRTVSFALVSLAFLFVLYLVYVQAFVLGSFCVLCLLSSATITVLFVLHLVERMKGPGPAVALSASLRPYAIAAVALVVLAGADVMLSDRNEATAPVARGDGADGSVQAALAAGGVSAECRYDIEAPRLPSFDRLITMETPYEGSPDAPVRALKIFDPNCPHCKHAHEVLQSQVMPRLGDEMQLFYQPHALWATSVPQIQALYLAAEQGKFSEMLDRQFQSQQAIAALRRQEGGEAKVLDGLVRIAEQIGMDGEALRREIEARKYVGLIEENRRLISESGINSVPRLVIEGRVIANTNSAWTPDCIGQLVEIAAKEKGAAISTATEEAGTEEAAAPPVADS